MKFITLILLLFSFNCMASSLSAVQLHNEISEKDGKTVVISLINNSKKWNNLLNQISTGKQQWLQLAFDIKPFTDAASAESLNFAVAKALPKNPEGVMKLIGKNFAYDEICTIPFIEADPKIENQYLDNAIAALEKYQNSSGDQKANKCLIMLQSLLVKS